MALKSSVKPSTYNAFVGERLKDKTFHAGFSHKERFQAAVQAWKEGGKEQVQAGAPSISQVGGGSASSGPSSENVWGDLFESRLHVPTPTPTFGCGKCRHKGDSGCWRCNPVAFEGRGGCAKCKFSPNGCRKCNPARFAGVPVQQRKRKAPAE